ncbi:MAG: RNA 2',3'-cyclic phosphodiesterase [Phycisphaerae bacterium]|jgi:2'-5' RNA ligase|nr:RNA 2',3'-cyclic phosphodiesterase [Phycisphaerae bacterium]MDP7636917.1 RNA 2',3'-cyclic phosphodiesterase [Phycisphaerae bacterium]
MAVRTFFAIDLDETARGRILSARRQLEAMEGTIKWTREDNLHVTMNFLGDVPDGRIAEICGLAQQCAGRLKPFDFAARGLACIPSRGQLRMIWVCVDDPTGRMAELHDALNRALGEIGMRTESRSFKGHVTLARIRSAANAEAIRRAVERFTAIEFGIVQVDRLVVYSSELATGGPIYRPLARAPLGG